MQRTYPGEVEAGERSEQAFRVAGELVKLSAKAGMKVKPAIEAIELPKGYHLAWGGEAESSADANAA